MLELPRPERSSTPSPGEASPPNIAEQLECLLKLLQEPLPAESLDGYRTRLNAVAARISKIAQELRGSERDRLEVVGANAASAACEHNDVPSTADAIAVYYSRFNRLAYDLPAGKIFDVNRLAEEWSRYQKAGSFSLTRGAINRLVKSGILERVGTDEVKRTSRPVILSGAGRTPPIPLHAVSPGPRAKPASRELITVDSIIKSIRENPSLADTSRHVAHAFGDHRKEDDMRLLVVSVMGLGTIQAGELWSPPLSPHAVGRHILKLTGFPITSLRVAVEQALVADFVELLTAKLSELAYDEAVLQSPADASKFNRNGGSLIAALALSEDPAVATGTEAQTAFGVREHDLTAFVGTVLYRAKEPFLTLLKSHPLARVIGIRGVNKVELIADYVLHGDSFQAIGRSVGVSGECIRQYRERVAGVHPLVEAIMDASAPAPASFRVTLPDELLSTLSEEIKRDPQVAYREGTEVDSSPLQLPQEDQTVYLRRIFLAAFAGRYVDGQKWYAYPLPLQKLPGGPNQFYRHLADECIDKSLEDAIKTFSHTLADDEIDGRLKSHGIAAQLEDLQFTRAFIRALVDHPTVAKEQLFRGLKSRPEQGDFQKVFALVEPVVRELGKVRAQQACAVLEEPWYAPWRPSERLLTLISKRIVEQLSIASSCAALRMTNSLYSATWHQLIVRLPTVQFLVPRSMRKSRMQGMY